MNKTPGVMEPGTATAVYARQFYELLKERATLEEILPSETDEAVSALIFRGKLMEVFAELKVAQTYYTRIRAIFLKYDCVTYIQRGTKSYDSVLALHHPPPEELPKQDLTYRPGDATLSAVAERVSDLERSAAKIESWLDQLGGINLVEVFRNFEGRIADLEKLPQTGGTNGKES